MKSTTNSLKLKFGEITYTLTRKDVKNINLRIKSDGNICVSANTLISVSYIESFLKEKEDFIFNAINRISKTKKEAYEWGIEYGKKLPIFDHEYKVFLIPSILNRASVDNDTIIIESSDIDDKKIISKSITDLYRSLAEKKINEIFLGAFNTVFPGSDNVPKIKIRKMTSMWGNCCPCKNTITFNIFLSALPEECIEYLVYHEIVHLIHADHSKDFYDTLERFLPNWKERKNKMRRYSEITRIF